ncbi:CLUMA_CG015203, isoform A [Clunio marinus]|uniref:CLUMA_CG015203, isoform A n=1 Tax=Clunio marinus TaxID=568069 RepID=A0A1J1IPZ7_9DIPT|nr:CLUMA_CG015203, isoform A [Clunio marinus]
MHFEGVVSGWNILEPPSSNHQWSLLENLPIVQVNFGVHPFFKVSIEDGNITLSEGELGLPDEQLYYYHREHPIIIAYKELIRDVHNSLKASTNSEAESFVDNLFGFERRIVAAMKTARQKGSVTKIFRLYDVKTRAHSLPIDTTIQNMFSNYRIDDDTPIKVKDLELIHQISVVATSTEPKILNDFVMWTLVRRFLPLMSHKIRSSLENFQRKLYGNQYNNMPWHFCTQLTYEWMRFGIESLQQNPQLIVVDSSKLKRDELDEQLSYEEHLNKDQQNFNDDFIRMIFYHLRDTFRYAISSASWIDSKFSDFVNYRLSSIRLQLGIPHNILRNHNYVQQYYHEFIINEINFMRNIEQHWNIEKKILGSLLKGNMTEENRIVFEMFSTSRNVDNRKVKYLKDLNLVIVDREILREPYYHYKYPLPVNFARIGTDLASILLEAAFEIGEEYKEILFMENQYTAQEDDILFKNTLEGDALKCISEFYSIDNVTFSTPIGIRKNLFSSITSVNIANRALGSLTAKIDKEPAQFDAALIKELNMNKRQNGLMKYGYEEIFSLTYMQKHCAIISDEYKNVKVFAEGKLPERQMFDIVWKNVPVLSDSFDCSSDIKLCTNIL